MTINLFSLEILIGLIIGLLLGVVAKSYFSKTETKDEPDNTTPTEQESE